MWQCLLRIVDLCRLHFFVRESESFPSKGKPPRTMALFTWGKYLNSKTVVCFQERLNALTSVLACLHIGAVNGSSLLHVHTYRIEIGTASLVSESGSGWIPLGLPVFIALETTIWGGCLHFLHLLCWTAPNCFRQRQYLSLHCDQTTDYVRCVLSFCVRKDW